MPENLKSKKNSGDVHWNVIFYHFFRFLKNDYASSDTFFDKVLCLKYYFLKKNSKYEILNHVYILVQISLFWDCFICYFFLV